MSKKTTKTTSTKAAKKTPAKTKPTKAKPEVTDAGGGILVEIAPAPAKKKPATKAPKLVEGSLSASFREAGDIHGISDPPETPTKKLSALDAATKILANTGNVMTTKELIQEMTDSGLWTSPGGKTPHATLYAAMLREINAKGKQARFKRVMKGKFSFNYDSLK